MQSNGLYPPLRVTKHDIEGFVVVSDEKIPKYSLITEYCGVGKFNEFYHYSSIIILNICS